MSPEDHLRSGDPEAALAALQALVRAKPADVKLRIFLFQLLCVLGDWKRAVTQLKVCGELDESTTPMTQTYREAIICEVYRAKVFAGDKPPLAFGAPSDWIAWLIEAQRLMATGNEAEAAELRARAFDAAPATSGAINGTPFSWIADADMRFGPVLEAVVNGRYFWIPFTAMHAIRMEPPSDLRDMVWTAANITLTNGGEIVALIPTRYPDTTSAGNAAEKLARVTTWIETPGGGFTGRGQRLLSTDADDFALHDIRVLELSTSGTGAG